MVDLKKATDECLNLCRAVAEGHREVVPEELERKLLVLSEQMHKVQQQWAQKHSGKQHIWVVLHCVLWCFIASVQCILAIIDMFIF